MTSDKISGLKWSDVFTFASGFDKKWGLPGLEMKEF